MMMNGYRKYIDKRVVGVIHSPDESNKNGQVLFHTSNELGSLNL